MLLYFWDQKTIFLPSFLFGCMHAWIIRLPVNNHDNSTCHSLWSSLAFGRMQLRPGTNSCPSPMGLRSPSALSVYNGSWIVPKLCSLLPFFYNNKAPGFFTSISNFRSIHSFIHSEPIRICWMNKQIPIECLLWARHWVYGYNRGWDVKHAFKEFTRWIKRSMDIQLWASAIVSWKSCHLSWT